MFTQTDDCQPQFPQFQASLYSTINPLTNIVPSLQQFQQTYNVPNDGWTEQQFQQAYSVPSGQTEQPASITHAR